MIIIAGYALSAKKSMVEYGQASGEGVVFDILRPGRSLHERIVSQKGKKEDCKMAQLARKGDVTVLSIGGSIINPGEPDVKFLAEFSTEIRNWLKENPEKKLVLVAGGGAPARVYQQALKDILVESGEIVNTKQETLEDGQDWLGIMATRINAQLVKEAFGDLCRDEVNTNPEGVVSLTGRILVGSGYLPGYSSDKDAVVLAKALQADTVINLSNIEKVYSDDPKKDPNAVPLDEISWKDYRAKVGNTWTPGMNTPFDPVASQLAEKYGIRVICAKGTNIENTMAILKGEEFVGTVIE